MDDEFIARFWRKTEISSDGCRIWLGALDSSGYGAVRRAGKTVGAHRVAWEIISGAIPAGLWVLHVICDNRRCVNPAHLCLGTPKTNTLDMNRKGRQR